MNIPVVIIAFNNYTYIKMMVEQLKKYNFNNIHIIDNNSSYPKLLEYYNNNKDINVIFMNTNYGHRVLFKSINREFYNKLPNFFILTDPDIQFNDNLPNDFVKVFSNMTEKYKVGKVGFSLSIQDHLEFKNITYTKFKKKKNIFQWESEFWKNQIDNDIYKASIDTTFAVYNKKYFKIVKNEAKFLNGIRIAGIYTAKHLPWYKKTILPKEELEYYNNNSICSFWGY